MPARRRAPAVLGRSPLAAGLLVLATLVIGVATPAAAAPPKPVRVFVSVKTAPARPLTDATIVATVLDVVRRELPGRDVVQAKSAAASDLRIYGDMAAGPDFVLKVRRGGQTEESRMPWSSMGMRISCALCAGVCTWPCAPLGLATCGTARLACSGWSISETLPDCLVPRPPFDVCLNASPWLLAPGLGCLFGCVGFPIYPTLLVDLLNGWVDDPLARWMLERHLAENLPPLLDAVGLDTRTPPASRSVQAALPRVAQRY